MRALKRALILSGVLVLTRYSLVYYNSSEFNNFVRHETERTRLVAHLKQSLLDKARVYSLPVRDSDISITTADTVLRVAVDYQVPVNLLVYKPELKFHLVASSLLHD
jgi:hypothetical protein